VRADEKEDPALATVRERLRDKGGGHWRAVAGRLFGRRPLPHHTIER
jgi:hypothetical protein